MKMKRERKQADNKGSKGLVKAQEHPAGVELHGDGSVCVYCSDVKQASRLAYRLRKKVQKQILTDWMFR